MSYLRPQKWRRRVLPRNRPRRPHQLLLHLRRYREIRVPQEFPLLHLIQFPIRWNDQLPLPLDLYIMPESIEIDIIGIILPELSSLVDFFSHPPYFYKMQMHLIKNGKIFRLCGLKAIINETKVRGVWLYTCPEFYAPSFWLYRCTLYDVNK